MGVAAHEQRRGDVEVRDCVRPTRVVVDAVWTRDGYAVCEDGEKKKKFVGAVVGYDMKCRRLVSINRLVQF